MQQLEWKQVQGDWKGHLKGDEVPIFKIEPYPLGDTNLVYAYNKDASKWRFLTPCNSVGEGMEICKNILNAMLCVEQPKNPIHVNKITTMQQLEWEQKHGIFFAVLNQVAYVVRPSAHQEGSYICHAEEGFQRGVRLLAIFPSIEECKKLCQKLANGERCFDQDGDFIQPILRR